MFMLCPLLWLKRISGIRAKGRYTICFFFAVSLCPHKNLLSVCGCTHIYIYLYIRTHMPPLSFIESSSGFQKIICQEANMNSDQEESRRQFSRTLSSDCLFLLRRETTLNGKIHTRLLFCLSESDF